MAISRQYRVSFDVPAAVWGKFGSTPEYERMVLEATRGAIASGCHHRDEAIEWAIYSNRASAEACQKRLMDMSYKLAARLLPAAA